MLPFFAGPNFIAAFILLVIGLCSLILLARFLAERLPKRTYLSIAIWLSFLLPALLLAGQSLVMTIPGFGECSWFDSIVPCSSDPVSFAGMIMCPFTIIVVPASLFVLYAVWRWMRLSE